MHWPQHAAAPSPDRAPNVPAGQGVGALEFKGQYDPAGHAAVQFASVRFVDAPYRPAGHGTVAVLFGQKDATGQDAATARVLSAEWEMTMATKRYGLTTPSMGALFIFLSLVQGRGALLPVVATQDI